MKKLPRFLLFVLALGSMLISACGAAPFEQTAGSKVQADTVAYTGVIEAINGDQWTINGQVLAVDPSIVRDGPFQVGDTVKVEAVVNLDGSLAVKSVEMPSAADLAASNPVSGPTSGPGQPDNSADGTEVVGTVESVTADTIVIDGKTFTVTNTTEFKDQIAAGDFVKIHIVVNADGTVTITEIEKADPTAMDDNSSSNSSSPSNSDSSSSSSYDDDSSHDSDEDQDSNYDDHDDKSEDEDHSGGSNDD